MGSGQAVFRLVARYGFKMKLGGKCIPAQGQFAQALQQRQMLGNMLPSYRRRQVDCRERECCPTAFSARTYRTGLSTQKVSCPR